MNVIAKISCYFKRSVVILKFAQRILIYSDIKYTSLTPDKILKSLVYRTLFYVNIYGSFKLSENRPDFWRTCMLNYVRVCCVRVGFVVILTRSILVNITLSSSLSPSYTLYVMFSYINIAGSLCSIVQCSCLVWQTVIRLYIKVLQRYVKIVFLYKIPRLSYSIGE